jgi:hypothetical protein
MIEPLPKTIDGALVEIVKTNVCLPCNLDKWDIIRRRSNWDDYRLWARNLRTGYVRIVRDAYGEYLL